MWYSRLFWKLFVSCAGLLLLAVAVFYFILTGWQEQQVDEQVAARLQDVTMLLSAELGATLVEDGGADLQSIVRHRGASIRARVTLIDIDGHVIADSNQRSYADVLQMENHASRPEVRLALTTGSGMDERVSSTLGVRLRYFALRTELEGVPVGVVRTALPVDEIVNRVQAIRRLIALTAAIVSLCVLAVTYWLVARLLLPVTTLTKTAEQIAGGDFEKPLEIRSSDELGDLAISLNRMRQELSDRIRELRESGQRLATVLGGMVEGVIAVDERHRLLFANDAASAMLGFSPQRAEGRPLMESVRSHRLHEAVANTIDTGKCRLELELGERGERVFSVLGSTLPGEPCPGVVLVLHEVSELRRLETLRQEFVANVSHELKTPLSVIKAYAETLQAGAWDDQQRREYFMLQIEEQAERLHQLILDLIRLARIEAGTQAFDIVAVSVPDTVRGCLDVHQAAAEAHGVTLHDEGELEPLFVRADEEGLRQILDNLVDNAIKYSRQGSQVRVGWGADNTTAWISVADTGIGIAPEHQPRLFERFFRVDKARSRELGGTGLGLSIVKHLTQSFGGNVQVVSQVGEGSTFMIRLDRIASLTTPLPSGGQDFA